jgi:hypothetical protein
VRSLIGGGGVCFVTVVCIQIGVWHVWRSHEEARMSDEEIKDSQGNRQTRELKNNKKS